VVARRERGHVRTYPLDHPRSLVPEHRWRIADGSAPDAV
jgi:hypothetical protein